MKIEVTKSGEVTVLGIDEQRIDVSNADALKKLLTEVLDDSRHIVIDVGPVRFMDTYGIGALLWCWMRLNACDGELRLCSIAEPVREVLDLVKVSDILRIHDSSQEAADELARALARRSRRKPKRTTKKRTPRGRS